MESLYTKYRPQTFADVVGQTHVVTTLERAVLEGRTSHAYLFCGPRGTGKTTMARLLAKALMCEQGDGHLPDGTCEQCRLIAAGEHPDVYELDAASRTGVDNVRDEIISRVSFAPVRARYKMYIIDEVHMLTTAAFNALLKTLEEPPSHVVFVLCTTDPQKIPETILSRVQRFDFHSIGNTDIQQRLAYICEREGFGYEPEALELVVRHARGGMRDAISELEQLSVSGGGQISVDVARDVLGEVSASTLERMSLAMAKRDVPTLFAQVESLVEVGRDLLQFTRALAARLRDVYVVAAIGAASGTTQASDDELPSITREAQAFGSVDRIARALGLLSDASTEMRVAPNQRLVLEVALTKIARPQTELTLEALADRVATLERQVVALSEPGVRRASTAAPAPAPAPAPVERDSRDARPVNRAAVAASAPESAWHEGEKKQAESSREHEHRNPVTVVPSEAAASEAAVTQAPQPEARPMEPAPRPAPRPQAAPTAAPAAPAPHPVPKPAPAPAPRPTPQPEPARQPAAAAQPIDAGELQRRWKQVVDTLLATHPQHGSLLMTSTVISDDGQTVLVSLPKGSAFAFRMLERADVRANVDPVVESVFGHRKARFVEGAPTDSSGGVAPTPAPAQRAAAPKAAPASAPAPVTRQAPQPAPAPAPARQPEPMPQPVPAMQPKPAPMPASQPKPAPVAAAQQNPASVQPSYPAPWEPLDEDAVPYDDFDMSPYEEEVDFAPFTQPAASPSRPVPQTAPSARQMPQPVPAPQPEMMTPVAPAQSPAPVPTQQPEPVSAQALAPSAQPRRQPEPVPAPTPQPELAPAPAPQATPAPMSQPAPAPTPAPQPEPAPKPKAKRTSRRTGGIPNDIIAMMNEIFGEGITYTSEPPEGAEPEPEPESSEDAEMDTSEDFADITAEEGEFVDEPLDDADYDDED